VTKGVQAITTAWAAAQTFANTVMTLGSGIMSVFNAVMAANPIGLVVLAIIALIAAGALLVANWAAVKDWFAGFFGWFQDKIDALVGAFKGVAGFFGLGGAEAGADVGESGKGGSASLIPSPQAAATVQGGVSQNMQQKTEIVVNGSGDPAATAAAVGREQNRVNADMARNMAGATR